MTRTPAAVWRMRHPVRFARAVLSRVIPLWWQRESAARREEGATSRSPWGEPEEWLAEVEAMLRIEADPSDVLPRVSIIVVSYENIAMTRLCVESVLRMTDYPDFEVVVIDNGSTDGTASWLSSNAGVRAILRETNAGFAAACNEAMPYATGEIVCILNNDVVVSPQWLRGLVDELMRDRAVGLVGPVTNSCGNEARLRASYGSLSEMLRFADEQRRTHRGKSFDIPMLALYCAAMWRQVWDDVGPLDERFGEGLFEDDDFALRLRGTGRALSCREDVFVHHWGRAAFRRLGARKTYEIYRRNRDRFRQKWRRAT